MKENTGNYCIFMVFLWKWIDSTSVCRLKITLSGKNWTPVHSQQTHVNIYRNNLILSEEKQQLAMACRDSLYCASIWKLIQQMLVLYSYTYWRGVHICQRTRQKCTSQLIKKHVFLCLNPLLPSLRRPLLRPLKWICIRRNGLMKHIKVTQKINIRHGSVCRWERRAVAATPLPAI